MEKRLVDKGVQATEQPQDNTRTKPQRHRKSRPDQVDPRPLPTMDEWLEVQAEEGCIYYGFYADDYALERALIAHFHEQMAGRDPADGALPYLALLWFRDHFKRPDLTLHIASLPQRAMDLNPTIKGKVGDCVYILGLFPLEEEAYFDRISQKETDAIAKMLGTKPTWWRILELMEGY